VNRFRNPRSLLQLLLFLLAVAALSWLSQHDDDTGGEVDDQAVETAWQDQRSGAVLLVAGNVQRVLADDNDGSRHQRFILGLPSGHTVLVAHNIDLAERVPLHEGDAVTLRGQYEWNERGGVIHWTHHDPNGRRDGGWIEHRGRRYR